MIRFIMMLAIFLGVNAQAMAAGQIMQCALKTPKGSEWIVFKLDARGRITPWDSSKWAVASKDAYWLDVFSNDVEEYGFEWQKSFVAPNGYSILELGTTADAFKLGINPKTNRGFFSYRDYGSGAGNFGPYAAVCRRIK